MVMDRLFLLSLLERAMSGALRIEDIPSSADEPLVIRRLVEDIEDGVEHIPGKLLGGINFQSWRKQAEYVVLYLDWKLLQRSVSLQDIAALRQDILKRNPRDTKEVDRLLRIEDGTLR